MPASRAVPTSLHGPTHHRAPRSASARARRSAPGARSCRAGLSSCAPQIGMWSFGGGQREISSAREFEVRGAHRILDAGRARGARDRDHGRRQGQLPRQDHLLHADPVVLGDALERWAAGRRPQPYARCRRAATTAGRRCPARRSARVRPGWTGTSGRTGSAPTRAGRRGCRWRGRSARRSRSRSPPARSRPRPAGRGWRRSTRRTGPSDPGGGTGTGRSRRRRAAALTPCAAAFR